MGLDMHYHQRSMLPQPKTRWKPMMCSECRGDDAHIIGFQCVSCEVIHLTPAGGSLWEENEDEIH